MAEIGKDINKAIDLLKRGELVAVPTETVYGLAGNALDADVVAKIFSVKNRPQFDPLIIHVPSGQVVEKYASDIPDKALKLIQKFWPGPLTIVLNKKEDQIPDLVTSGLQTVGIRCPDHLITHELLKQLPFPLAAPSANPFGYVSPTTAQHVNDQLGNKISYILDGGACPIGIESTIIGFDETDSPIVYRRGGLEIETIEALIGSVIIQTYSASNPLAPGQLKSHYAPAKKLIIGNLDELVQRYPSKTSGILSFSKDYQNPNQRILTTSGSTVEAAKNLFKFLREFDSMPIAIILTELVPDHGLGAAINDRLIRAATETDNH